MKNKPTLYLLRGLPGSGKSTLAKQMLASGLVQKHFEADQYFVDEITGAYNFDMGRLGAAHYDCQASTLESLSQGLSVVVSNTSTTEQEVNKYKYLSEVGEANFISLIVENRRGSTSIHNVPADVLSKMKKRFTISL